LRAADASRIAPHYRHGGIVFGPHPRNLSAHLPKKARRVALLSALTAKANDDAIVVLESMGLDAISTKAAAALLVNLGVSGKTMVVLPEHTPTIYKSFRNIKNVQVRVVPAFSVQDVLDAEQIVFVQAALDKLNVLYGKDTREEEAAE
jgi:large subunit ribosomal protein L4